MDAAAGFTKRAKRKLENANESETRNKKFKTEPTATTVEEQEDKEVKSGTSRSGLRRGFNKFGEGNTLGEKSAKRDL